MRYAAIGTVSEGSLRSEDLLTSLADELDFQIGRQTPETRNMLDVPVLENFKDADEAVEALIEALQEFAAPCCYFGTHPRDGADFGFWPDWEEIEDLKRNGELSAVSDPNEVELQNAPCVLVINDHGNTTLYCQGKVAWDCV